MEETKRDYLFDNLKVLLIFLVVFGHSLENYISNDMVLRSIYFFIFMFHMPLFIFISGYFSKNVDKCRGNAIRSLLIPFVFFNIIWYISIGKMERPIYYAGWTLWYLLSLFFWRFSLKYIIKIKWILVISVLLGLFIDAIDKYNFLLVFSRTVTFLPFFLLGYYSNSSIIKRIKSCSKVISILGLMIMGLFAFVITKYELINYKFLYMSLSYKNFGFGIFQGSFLRILFYILAILVSIFVINLVSSRKQGLSKIGRNTLIIYLGHIYIIRWINKLVPTYNSTIAILAISIAFSILICAILSLPIFLKLYKYVFGKINYCMDTILLKLNIE